MRTSILALVVLFLAAFVGLRTIPKSHRGHLA